MATVFEFSEMEDDEMQVPTPSRSPFPLDILLGASMVTSPTSGSPSRRVYTEKGWFDYSEIFQRQIYKVNYSLKRVNELEYEPLILSIGPYHHRTKERYQDMENCKELYLQLLCDRANINQSQLQQDIRNMEEQVRASYASTHRPFESEEFVQMMVLDGCFVVELFRRFEHSHLREADTVSPIFKIEFFLGQLFRDLLLFENQLPLCVLNKLFELTKEEDEKGDFVDLSVRCLQSFLHKPRVDYDNQNSQDLLCESPHLLGLAYLIYLLPFPAMPSNNIRSYEEIRSATALQEAGVEFRRADSDKGFGAVKFDDGVLEMPNLRIDDNSESLIRNFIAYELYSERSGLHRVIDYFILMSCLINSPKDVELLRHAGNVSNESGNDEKATRMMNELTCSVTYRTRTFYYAEEFEQINLHCAKKMNVWKAKLNRDYFNSPWAPISALAAFTLLVLTFIQTTFSLLSYVDPKS